MFPWIQSLTLWWSVDVWWGFRFRDHYWNFYKYSSYQLSPWLKFMSDLLSSFWQISQITKTHGPHEWPMRGTLMGHTWVANDGVHWHLQPVATWGPHICLYQCPFGPAWGQCTFATTQLAKFHGLHQGPMCVPLETPTSQVITRVIPSKVQWQGLVSMLRLDPAS